MALGVLLAGGALGAYLAGKRQYLYDDAAARILENGRYATRLLARELEMSGFYAGLVGGKRPPAQGVGVDCNSGTWALDARHPLELVDAHSGSGVPVTSGGTNLTCVDGTYVVPGSDLVAVKRTASAASVAAGSALPDLTASRVPTWFLRTDRGLDPLWQVHRPADLRAAALLEPRYSYWEARARVFFLRDYAQYPGDGLPALCMEELAGDAMLARCLVEGVEDMQFEFGVDTSGDGAVDSYRQNPSAAELAASRMVRVHLLLRSPYPLPGQHDDKTYFLGQKAVPGGGDRYMRRVFSSTVILHNNSEVVLP